MKATDFDLEELLQPDPAGGILRFANERALPLDAVAIGVGGSRTQAKPGIREAPPYRKLELYGADLRRREGASR